MRNVFLSSPEATADFRFQRRPLTRDEAATLVAEIAAEPDITGYSLSEWAGGKDVFLLYDKSRKSVAAAILVHHLLGDWSEIAVVYVRPAYRGKQLARRLLQLTVETLQFAMRHYVIFYSTQQMERMLSASGFTLFQDSEEFAQQRARWRLYFRLLYKPQWLFNVYRVKELLRKQKLFRKTFCFSVGILPHSP